MDITCKVESLSFIDGKGFPRSLVEGEHADVDDATANELIKAGHVAKKTGRPAKEADAKAAAKAAAEADAKAKADADADAAAAKAAAEAQKAAKP